MKIQTAFPYRKLDRNGRRIVLTLIAAIAAPFLLAMLVSALRQARMPSVSEPSITYTGALSQSAPRVRQGGEILSRLENYARFIETETPAAAAAPRELLPDVNTMMDRLTARLEASPDDATGWRMLGWSNFHLERYEQAAVAYAKALELEPTSEELRLSYEEAVAKASRPREP